MERDVETDAGNRNLVVFRGASTLRTSWGFTWETQRGGNPRSLCLEIGPYFQLSPAEAKSRGKEMVQAIMDGNKDWLEKYNTSFKYGPTVGDIYKNILIQDYNYYIFLYNTDVNSGLFFLSYNCYESLHRVVTEWIYGIIDEPIECIPPNLLLKFAEVIFPLDTELYCLFDDNLRLIEEIFEKIKEKGITQVNLAEGLQQFYNDVLCSSDLYKTFLFGKNFPRLLAKIHKSYKSSKRESLRLACALKIQTYIFLDTKKLLNLRWNDINFTKKLLKGRHLHLERDLPLPEQVMDILYKLKSERKKEKNQLIFYSKNNKDEPIDEGNYRKRLRKCIGKNIDISMIKDVFKVHAFFFFVSVRDGNMDGFNLWNYLGRNAPYKVPEDLAPEKENEWILNDMRTNLIAYANYIDRLTEEGLKELD